MINVHVNVVIAFIIIIIIMAPATSLSQLRLRLWAFSTHQLATSWLILEGGSPSILARLERPAVYFKGFLFWCSALMLFCCMTVCRRLSSLGNRVPRVSNNNINNMIIMSIDFRGADAKYLHAICRNSCIWNVAYGRTDLLTGNAGGKMLTGFDFSALQRTHTHTPII